MTAPLDPRVIHDLLSVLVLLRSGRPDAAREAIERVIRENGGCVPTGPVIEFKASREMPVWMRRS